MTNKECVEHLKRFRFGIAFLNTIVLDEADKDKIDLEAIDHAIKALEDNDRLKSDIDGLNNQIDDLCENLAWYINERNRLIAKLKEKDNEDSN